LNLSNLSAMRKSIEMLWVKQTENGVYHPANLLEYPPIGDKVVVLWSSTNKPALVQKQYVSSLQSSRRSKSYANVKWRGDLPHIEVRGGLQPVTWHSPKTVQQPDVRPENASSNSASLDNVASSTSIRPDYVSSKSSIFDPSYDMKTDDEDDEKMPIKVESSEFDTETDASKPQSSKSSTAYDMETDDEDDDVEVESSEPALFGQQPQDRPQAIKATPAVDSVTPTMEALQSSHYDWDKKFGLRRAHSGKAFVFYVIGSNR